MVASYGGYFGGGRPVATPMVVHPNHPPTLRFEERDLRGVRTVGIDTDTFKLTVCSLPWEDGTPPEWETLPLRKKSAEFFEGLLAVDEAIARSTLIPGASVVWIERGYGMSRRADFGLGAIYGACVAAIIGRSLGSDANRVAINSMDLREWKREVTWEAKHGLTVKGAGNGNAKKEVANEACRKLLSRLVWYHASPDQLPGFTPDELDAYGIAWAGREMNKRAVA